MIRLITMLSFCIIDSKKLGYKNSYPYPWLDFLFAPIQEAIVPKNRFFQILCIVDSLVPLPSF